MVVRTGATCTTTTPTGTGAASSAAWPPAPAERCSATTSAQHLVPSLFTSLALEALLTWLALCSGVMGGVVSDDGFLKKFLPSVYEGQAKFKSEDNLYCTYNNNILQVTFALCSR